MDLKFKSPPPILMGLFSSVLYKKEFAKQLSQS